MSTADTSSISLLRALLSLSVTLVLILVPTMAFSQISEDDLRLPISIDADSTNYDGKNSMLMFKGLRLTQGKISIEADEGRATKLDFEDAVWRFSGHVVINTENGRIECDAADLHFTDHQLQIATITGLPATFEMKRPDSTETTYGEANKLDYNFALGIIEFSENASIIEGGNQISSSYLVYNIAEQRINALSAGADGERVKITYTPKPLATATDPANEDAGDTDTHDNEQSISESDGDSSS